MFEISPGRRVLITGGASGFGFGAASSLRQMGHDVAIADIDADALGEAARRLGGSTMSVQMDVRDAISVRASVEAIVQNFGGLDTVINSAGVCFLRPFEELTEEDWDLVIDVNLKGTFLVTQAAAPHLRASGRGAVVNLSSAAGRKGVPYLAAYVSSKFGVIGLTETLALELAPHGVRVNAVIPSTTPETAMGRAIAAQKVGFGWGANEDDVLDRAARAGFPLGRLGKVEDVVNGILFLISDGASFVTGHSLAVDGGSLLGGPPQPLVRSR